MTGKIFLAKKAIPKIGECHTVSFLSFYVQTKWYGAVLSGVLDIKFVLQAHYQNRK